MPRPPPKTPKKKKKKKERERWTKYEEQYLRLFSVPNMYVHTCSPTDIHLHIYMHTYAHTHTYQYSLMKNWCSGRERDCNPETD